MSTLPVVHHKEEPGSIEKERSEVHGNM